MSERSFCDIPGLYPEDGIDGCPKCRKDVDMPANLASEANNLISEMERIVGLQELDWEDKYDLVFQIYAKWLRLCLEKLGMRFEWYDPDTSYEDDVKAMMACLAELKPKLKAIAS